jgi:hypothetical protein
MVSVARWSYVELVRLPHLLPLHRHHRDERRVSLLAVETYVDDAGDPYACLGARPPAPSMVHRLVIPNPPARPLAAAS